MRILILKGEGRSGICLAALFVRATLLKGKTSKKKAAE